MAVCHPPIFRSLSLGLDYRQGSQRSGWPETPTPRGRTIGVHSKGASSLRGSNEESGLEESISWKRQTGCQAGTHPHSKWEPQKPKAARSFQSHTFSGQSHRGGTALAELDGDSSTEEGRVTTWDWLTGRPRRMVVW